MRQVWLRQNDLLLFSESYKLMAPEIFIRGSKLNNKRRILQNR